MVGMVNQRCYWEGFAIAQDIQIISYKVNYYNTEEFPQFIHGIGAIALSVGHCVALQVETAVIGPKKARRG